MLKGLLKEKNLATKKEEAVRNRRHNEDLFLVDLLKAVSLHGQNYIHGETPPEQRARPSLSTAARSAFLELSDNTSSIPYVNTDTLSLQPLDEHTPHVHRTSQSQAFPRRELIPNYSPKEWFICTWHTLWWPENTENVLYRKTFPPWTGTQIFRDVKATKREQGLGFLGGISSLMLKSLFSEVKMVWHSLDWCKHWHNTEKNPHLEEHIVLTTECSGGSYQAALLTYFNRFAHSPFRAGDADLILLGPSECHFTAWYAFTITFSRRYLSMQQSSD